MFLRSIMVYWYHGYMSTKGIEMPNELELYPHNEKAYRKLLDMLSETRRACIIHPTGTGKAFIAYR